MHVFNILLLLSFPFAENMIKGLDDDEIDFLELVDRTKLAADRKKTLEEEKELNDYRNRVATLHQQEMDQKIYTDNLKKPKTPVNNRTSQVKLLKGAVVKKTGGDRKRKHSETESEDDVVSNSYRGEEDDVNPVTSGVVRDEAITGEKVSANTVGAMTGVIKCIGVLPGMGCYDDSSSDDSSNSDVEDVSPAKKVDLLGRKIVQKKH